MLEPIMTPEVKAMLPKVLLVVLSLITAILVGVIIDEWLNIRAIQKDIDARKKLNRKIEAELDEMRKKARQTFCAEQKATRLAQLRKLLPISGCLWHNND